MPLYIFSDDNTNATAVGGQHLLAIQPVSDIPPTDFNRAQHGESEKGKCPLSTFKKIRFVICPFLRKSDLSFVHF